MIDVDVWLTEFLQALDTCFGERAWFVGLQGSYGRGEATETSDIDVVVILDELSAPDIRAYNAMLSALSHREAVCGFLSGRRELMSWEPSELFQFYHDTKPVRGSLDGLLPRIDGAAVDRAIKMGVCGVYHGCVHNMLHEKSDKILRGLYKSASFVTQAICFKRTGRYAARLKEVCEAVGEEDRAVVDVFLELKKGGPVRFDEMSGLLFSWAKGWLTKG